MGSWVDPPLASAPEALGGTDPPLASPSVRGAGGRSTREVAAQRGGYVARGLPAMERLSHVLYPVILSGSLTVTKETVKRRPRSTPTQPVVSPMRGSSASHARTPTYTHRRCAVLIQHEAGTHSRPLPGHSTRLAHSDEIYRQEEAQIHPRAARHRGLGCVRRASAPPRTPT